MNKLVQARLYLLLCRSKPLFAVLKVYKASPIVGTSETNLYSSLSETVVGGKVSESWQFVSILSELHTDTLVYSVTW